LSSPVVQLPEAQLRPLLAAYDASVRTRRLHTLFVLACIVAAMLLASASAEVSPARLVDNIGRFPSYIIRLFQLESGQPAWTDFTEWFWGLPRWLRLLGETLLMAYVGTLLGAAGVNIQAAQLSEDAEGDSATILLRLDQDVPGEVRAEIASAVSASKLEVVDLT